MLARVREKTEIFTERTEITEKSVAHRGTESTEGRGPSVTLTRLILFLGKMSYVV
jgi:hypothetical protein